MPELLKCPSCSKKSAFVTTKGKLEKITGVKNSGDYFFKQGATGGFMGAGAIATLQRITIDKLIDLIETIFNKLFGWFEDNNKSMLFVETVVIMNYWRKIVLNHNDPRV